MHRSILAESASQRAKIILLRLDTITEVHDYSAILWSEGARMKLKYLHTMVRVADLEKSLRFYCEHLGLKEVERYDYPDDRFTLVMLAAPGDEEAQIELTYNYDPETLSGGRNFGHLAYRVSNIYEVCERLMAAGVTLNRPPRDGRMAFVRSPDDISIELLQEGDALPIVQPWADMPNVGEW